jgi:arginine decarboxylase
MRKYIELIKHTFYFDSEDFKVDNNELLFNSVPLMPLIEKYGTPLRFTYLPKISQNIQRSKALFAKAFERTAYNAEYHYCYCTKSSHFSFVLEEALKNDIHIETSSGYDIDIVRNLHQKGLIPKGKFILCNGSKDETYIRNIRSLLDDDFNCVPILDSTEEIEAYQGSKLKQIGLRLATDEEPDLTFYTSRLGIRFSDLMSLYREKIADNEGVELKLLHFFINSGIKDTVHFWSEFNKFMYAYCELRKICPTLDSVDIGGGFPIKTSLGFEYNYEYMTEAIVSNIKSVCEEHNVPLPHIFTEFGSFTVGESGGLIYSVLAQKQQNDKELWYMLDGSLITQLPDTWGLNQKFVMLAVNNWDNEYQQVHLGGRTCDSMDYYTSEMHIAKIMLPKIGTNKQYVGFFNMGAYQESLGGFGGIQHCLIPGPKFVIIDRKEDGSLTDRLFKDQQSSESMLKILGYL